MITAIQNKYLIIVSDGWFYPNKRCGISATKIYSGNLDNTIPICNIVPEIPKDQILYQSKLAGMYKSIHFLSFVSHCYNLDSGRVTYSCNWESTLYLVFEKPCFSNQPEFDFVSAIKACIINCAISINWGHVRRQQDNDTPLYLLPLIAQINEEANTSANHYSC